MQKYEEKVTVLYTG